MQKAPAGRPTHVRYLILLLVFVITMVSYGDRATLSITGPVMKTEFGFDAAELGYIFSAFSWAYVLAQLPGGWLLDRFGARVVYAVGIFVWSVFTLLQAGTGTFFPAAMAIATLFVLRFGVGLAEAPAFPANSKVVAAWFPTAERGTASAIFNAAQYGAVVVFTPLMAWLTHVHGWHHVYIWMGALGVLLALVWIWFARDPAKHRWANREELEHLRKGGALMSMGEGRSEVKRVDSMGTWGVVRQLLTSRMLLGIYLAQFCINVVTYFFLTWFPVYLVQARGMSILKAGLIASLPAIFGFVGGVLGGIVSDFLIRRGSSLTFARKTPIVIGLLMSTCIIGCNYVDAEWIVVALMSLAFFGKGIGALGWAVMSDAAPKEAVGLAGSIFNMFGNVAGIVTPIVIGYIVNDTQSFNGALVFVGVNALVAVLSYLFIVGRIQRVELKPMPPREPVVAPANELERGY